MSVLETELRKFKAELRKEMKDLKRIVITRMIPDKWVQTDVACAMLNIKPRQLQNVRLHDDKEGKRSGSIKWKKSGGRNVLYYLPDIEKYNSSFEVLQ